MQVIEEFIQSRTGDMADCEDKIVITDNFVAIFDGASAKTSGQPRLYDGKTAGQVAVNTLAEALEMLPSDANRKATVILLNSAIDVMYDEYDIKDKAVQSPAERFTAQGVIYSKHYHEIWTIGGAHCRYGEKSYYDEHLVDNVAKHARSIFIQHGLRSGLLKPEMLKEKDVGRDFIMPLLLRQYAFANASAECEYGFAVFNGFDMEIASVKRHILTPSHSEIVLASDGYPQLFATLEESEDHLKKMLTLDPHCIYDNKGTKGVHPGNASYDDRAFIRFSI